MFWEKRQILSNFALILWGALAAGICSCSPKDVRVPVAVMTKLEAGSIVGTSEINATRQFLEAYPDSLMEIVPVNDDWNPEKAREALKEVETRGIKFMVTSHVSTCAVAIQDQINKDKILTIVSGATTDALSETDDYILRNIPDVRHEQRCIAEKVNTLPRTRLAIVTDKANAAYTEPALKYFLETNKKEVVLTMEVSTDALALDEVTVKLRAVPFDLVYLVVGGYRSSAVGAMAQSAVQVNPEATVILTPWVKSPVLLEAAGAAIKNCILPAHYPARGENPVIDQYVDRFRTKYGYAPTFISLNVYTALEILNVALNSGRRTPEEVRQYVLQRKTFETTFGTTTFDANGDVQMPVYFITDIAREF